MELSFSYLPSHSSLLLSESSSYSSFKHEYAMLSGTCNSNDGVYIFLFYLSVNHVSFFCSHIERGLSKEIQDWDWSACPLNIPTTFFPELDVQVLMGWVFFHSFCKEGHGYVLLECVYNRLCR